jgi:hypothetical protein
VSSRRARVVFGAEARDVAVYRPSRRARPVTTRSSARAMPVDLGADLVLVGFR